MKTFQILLLSLLLIFGCTTEAQEPISYTSHTDSLSHNDLGIDLKFERLKLTGGAPKPVLERIQAQIDTIQNRQFDGSIQEVFESWVEMKAEARAADEYYGQMDWYQELTVDDIQTHNGVFTMGTSVYAFTGGAHPNGYVRYLNFDVRTGELLTWPSLVKPDKVQALTDYAEAVFRKSNDLQPGAELTAAGHYFTQTDADGYPFGAVAEGEFRLSNEFRLTEKHLILYYNSYEIAPYVMPPVELNLPLDDCRQYLNLPN